MQISPESCPKRGDQVLAQRAEDTLILLNLEQGNYFALNEVGDRVWELCDGTRPVSEVVAIIGREYDATPEVIEADVFELLGELANEKLLAEPQ